MKTEVSVGSAIMVGRVVVNGPVFLLLFAPGLLALKLVPNAGAWILCVFVAGFILAWLWWSISIPRWRVWAYERVASISELKSAAVLAGLTWPDGHVFERSEIKSAAIRERERNLEASKANKTMEPTR